MIHPFQQWLCKLGSVSSKAEEGLKLKMIFLHSKIVQEPVVITLNFERLDAKQTVAEISFQLELFLSAWNSLPFSLVNCETLVEFKKGLKCHDLSQF